MRRWLNWRQPRRCLRAMDAFGELRAATYGRGIWQIPLLTAASPAQPSMTLNPRR